MEDNDFAALVKSIQEAGKIKRGQGKPSRVFEFMRPSEESASYSSQAVPHKRLLRGEDHEPRDA